MPHLLCKACLLNYFGVDPCTGATWKEMKKSKERKKTRKETYCGKLAYTQTTHVVGSKLNLASGYNSGNSSKFPTFVKIALGVWISGSGRKSPFPITFAGHLYNSLNSQIHSTEVYTHVNGDTLKTASHRSQHAITAITCYSKNITIQFLYISIILAVFPTTRLHIVDIPTNDCGYTRRLAIANRSRISVRGGACKNLPHIVWSPCKIWLLFLTLCVRV